MSRLSNYVYNAIVSAIKALRGTANGLAPLNSEGKVDASYLSLETTIYIGTWDISNGGNLPGDGTYIKGYYYIVNNTVSNPYTLDDEVYYTGDWLMSTGTSWTHISNSSGVTKVNNKTGSVTLYASDIALSSSDSTTISSELSSKQDTLTFDSTPTSSSTNPVTSGGTKTYVDNKISALDASSVGGSGKYIQSISETDGIITATAVSMDTTPTSGSTNPVTSNGVYNYVPTKAESLQSIRTLYNSGYDSSLPYSLFATLTVPCSTSSNWNINSSIRVKVQNASSLEAIGTFNILLRGSSSSVASAKYCLTFEKRENSNLDNCILAYIRDTENSELTIYFYCYVSSNYCIYRLQNLDTEYGDLGVTLSNGYSWVINNENTSITQSSSTMISSDDISGTQLTSYIGNVISSVQGTLPIANGGTGGTTSLEAQYNLLNGMNNVTTSITDSTNFVGAYSSGTTSTGSVFKETFVKVWTYIKGKIDSIVDTEVTSSSSNLITSGAVKTYTDSVIEDIIDDELDEESTNTVSNSAITTAINDLDTRLLECEGVTSNYIQPSQLYII